MFSSGHSSDAMEVLCALLSRAGRELEMLRAFVIYDWKYKADVPGYGSAVLDRWQHALLAQLSVLVLLAYLKLHFESPTKVVILYWTATIVLIVLSLILLPYAIYVSADFLFFFFVRYVGHGIWVRYPLYRSRQTNFESAVSSVGAESAVYADDAVFCEEQPWQGAQTPTAPGYTLDEERQH